MMCLLPLEQDELLDVKQNKCDTMNAKSIHESASNTKHKKKIWGVKFTPTIWKKRSFRRESIDRS